MQTTALPYPHFAPAVEKAKGSHAFGTFSYDQYLEIANLLYFVNEHVSKKTLFRRNPLILNAEKRSMHKEIYDACTATCLSLEEAAMYTQEKT